MSYSAFNSNIVSVTNFGARPDGVTDNRNQLQNAINSSYNSQGSTIFFPRGIYYWSGTLDITGNNLSFLGEAGSRLLSAPDESTKKINISGASNILFAGLSFDGNRTSSSHLSNQNGFISTINSDLITIRDSNLFNTRNSLIFLGPGSRGVDIYNNIFSGHFCGVYSFVDTGQAPSSGFNIVGNRFLQSYLVSEQGESANIKLQTSSNNTGYFSVGHTIADNYIDNFCQMGIEIWSFLSNCIISNNSINNTYWGISLDHSKDITVDSNTIRGVKTYGIETATRCENIIVSNNVVDNFALTGSTRIGSAGLVATNGSTNVKFLGNFVRGFSERDVHLYRVNNIDVQTNSIFDSNQCLTLQDSSFINLNNNIIGQQSGSVSNYIFLDYSTLPVTGISIQNNRFQGATSSQGIQVYGGSSSNQVNGFLLRNNFLDQNVWCTNGVMWYSNFREVVNISIGGNFGPTGGASENTIADYSTAGYGDGNLYAGIQYYKQSTLTIPTGGIIGNGAWYKIYDTAGNAGGVSPRIRIINGEDGSFDNTRTNVEIMASMNPYGGNNIKHALTLQPQSPYGSSGSFLREVRTSYQGDGSQVWVRLGPISAGSVGRPITFYFSDNYGVNSFSGQYNEPSWPSESAQIINDPLSSQTYLKVSDGISIGTGVSISAQNGVMTMIAPSIALSNISTSVTAGSGSAVLPANPVGFMLVNITGANFKIPYYNV